MFVYINFIVHIMKYFVIKYFHFRANQPELFSVQYGILELTELEPNVVPVKNITVHEGYVDDGNVPNDIAIVEVL